MKKVTKAVIPAAGLGTRMLPIARSVPKEVLPVVDKPVMEYLVREAVNSGITDILIITNRGKGVIEDYFDLSPEYEDKLRAKGKLDEIEKMRELISKANIYFVRRKNPKVSDTLFPAQDPSPATIRSLFSTVMTSSIPKCPFASSL